MPAAQEEAPEASDGEDSVDNDTRNAQGALRERGALSWAFSAAFRGQRAQREYRVAHLSGLGCLLSSS